MNAWAAFSNYKSLETYFLSSLKILHPTCIRAIVSIVNIRINRKVKTIIMRIAYHCHYPTQYLVIPFVYTITKILTCMMAINWGSFSTVSTLLLRAFSTQPLKKYRQLFNISSCNSSYNTCLISGAGRWRYEKRKSNLKETKNYKISSCQAHNFHLTPTMYPAVDIYKLNQTRVITDCWVYTLYLLCHMV